MAIRGKLSRPTNIRCGRTISGIDVKKYNVIIETRIILIAIGKPERKNGISNDANNVFTSLHPQYNDSSVSQPVEVLMI